MIIRGSPLWPSASNNRINRSCKYTQLSYVLDRFNGVKVNQVNRKQLVVPPLPDRRSIMVDVIRRMDEKHDELLPSRLRESAVSPSLHGVTVCLPTIVENKMGRWTPTRS